MNNLKKPAFVLLAAFSLAAVADENGGITKEEVYYEALFNRAEALEAVGGEENLKAAISLYRQVGKKHPLKASLRLAPLLESFDIKESLYHYEIAAKLSPHDSPKAEALFRAAQIYQTGGGTGNKEIEDPGKAANLYREAFNLGVSKWKIAEEYGRLQDYENAVYWVGMESFFPVQKDLLGIVPQEPYSDEENLLLTDRDKRLIEAEAPTGGAIAQIGLGGTLLSMFLGVPWLALPLFGVAIAGDAIETEMMKSSVLNHRKAEFFRKQLIRQKAAEACRGEFSAG